MAKIEVWSNGKLTLVEEATWWSRRSDLFGAASASIVQAGGGSIIPLLIRTRQLKRLNSRIARHPVLLRVGEERRKADDRKRRHFERRRVLR